MDEKRAAESRLEEFFRARLSIRSGHGNDRASPGASPSGCQLAECDQGIGDDKRREAEADDRLWIVYNKRSRASITRFSKKCMRIMTFSTQRDKQIAALDGTRVGRDSAEWL